jgi:hypothetical protein
VTNVPSLKSSMTVLGSVRLMVKKSVERIIRPIVAAPP